MIVQNVSKDSKTDISFTAPEEQKDDVMNILSNLTKDLNAEGSDKDENIARVSIIGAGNVGSSCAEYISLKSIATTTQLNKSTIIRICRSLIKHNFLVKDEFTGNYQLGYSSWKIGSIFKNTFQVDAEMRNILKNICIKTGQSVGYWIRTGQKKVCLYRVNSKSELNHHLTEGSVYPLVAGSGKILLAYSENKTKLIKEIEKKGYIHTAEERVKNIASVAIPIFNSENKFCGVLNDVSYTHLTLPTKA